jgi:tRNA(fMet)-specific endonuclease VapC
MDGSLLLDTNAVAALLAGDVAVRQRIAASHEALISVMTLGELYLGARRSRCTDEEMSRIDAFVRDMTVLHCSPGTAYQYAAVKAALRAKGRPIPENDIWIAATALEHGLILLTRDAHFQHVEGLSVESW